jgi:hypothetical protein
VRGKIGRPPRPHLSLLLGIAGRQRHPTCRLAIEADLEGVLAGAGQWNVEHQHCTRLDIDYSGRRLAKLHRAFATQELGAFLVDEPDPYGMHSNFGAAATDPEDQVSARIHRGKIGKPDMLKDSEHTQLSLLVNQRVIRYHGEIEVQGSGNPDRGDDVVLLDLVHHVHAFGHLAENGMDPVQVWLGSMSDEELTATGVLPRMSH